ncbi:MAG: hypothetical protein FIB01_16465 [Gemmatimonadetes bacterium]|nr:hypothetical protein [Gemmatimonadota bacterium]
MNSSHRNRTIIGTVALAAGLLAGCGPDRPHSRATAPPDTAALRALVDSLLPELGRLASLQPRAPVRIARRTAAEVRDYVERQLAEEMPPALARELQSVYSLLGLIPDTLDLRRLLLELYTEQIVGYYDPQARTLYVVAGVAPETVAPVLAHELVHALQDQYANLDSLIARGRGIDRRSAAHAAIEGHATVVMFAFLAEQGQGRRLDPAQLPSPAADLAAGLRARNDQFPVFRTAPAIIRETVLFPYIGGSDFVYRLWQAEPRERPAPLGRWLPQSTEQVLHPEASFLTERDDPTDVAPPAPPAGWQPRGRADQLGELEAGSFLAQRLGEAARALAAGWDGDSYQLLTGPNGQPARAWLTVWDDAASAARFAAALRRIAAADRVRRYRVQEERRAGRPAVYAFLYAGVGNQW